MTDTVSTNAPSKWTIDTLCAAIDDMKIEALAAGRYPTPHSVQMYASRYEYHGMPLGPYATVPFRCITYEVTIRRITALERVREWLVAGAARGRR